MTPADLERASRARRLAIPPNGIEAGMSVSEEVERTLGSASGLRPRLEAALVVLQWMRGGMTMVGDMFNSRLQSTVSGLCSELSALLAAQPVFVAPPQSESSFGSVQSWWPAELG